MKSRCPKISSQILSLALIPLALPIMSPATAFAAKRNKAAPAKEVYAATDANVMQPGEAGFAMPVDSEPGAALAVPAVTTTLKTTKAPAAQSSRSVAAVKAVAPAASAAAAKAPQNSRITAASYDTVPASQSDAILQRLKVVENLIRKYGRAYDYRTHTLKELERIQSTLEGSTAPVVVAPAPQAAASTPAVETAPVNASAATAAPQAASDTIHTGQAAAVEENAENVNLGALPPPADYTPDPSQTPNDQEN